MNSSRILTFSAVAAAPYRVITAASRPIPVGLRPAGERDVAAAPEASAQRLGSGEKSGLRSRLGRRSPVVLPPQVFGRLNVFHGSVNLRNLEYWAMAEYAGSPTATSLPDDVEKRACHMCRTMAISL